MAVDTPIPTNDADRKWQAGGDWWEKFIRVHHGLWEKADSLEYAQKVGYLGPQVGASYVGWEWIEEVTIDRVEYYQFTDLSWRHLATDWRAYRDANRHTKGAWAQDRG